MISLTDIIISLWQTPLDFFLYGQIGDEIYGLAIEFLSKKGVDVEGGRVTSDGKVGFEAPAQLNL